MHLKDISPGYLALVQHRMPDGSIREILYVREQERPGLLYDYDVPICRIRVMQGQAGHAPRYDTGIQFCRDPGEADGRTVVLAPYDSLWLRETMAAYVAYRENGGQRP